MNIQQLHLIVYAKEEWKQMNNGMGFFQIEQEENGRQVEKRQKKNKQNAYKSGF